MKPQFRYVCIVKETKRKFTPTMIDFDNEMVWWQKGQASENGEWLSYDDVIFENKITRVEVIDETGRKYVNWSCDNVDIQLQDDDRTLKIFITKDTVNDQPNFSHNEAIKLAKKMDFPTEYEL